MDLGLRLGGRQLEHITLPALKADRTVATYEVLEVEQLDATSVRLLHSPAYVHGIARGDVIALDAGEVSGFRVRQRSGMLALVLALPSADVISPALPALTKWVQEVGGHVEGGSPRLHVFSIPVAAGFASIERQLDAAASATEGAAWWYNNVYELGGKHLLDWWST